MTDRQLHINVNALPAGAHPAAWRASDGNPHSFYDPHHYARLAQVAERGLLDAVFLADNSFLRAGGGPFFSLDPVVVVSAMAQATSRIGLIASVSTTFHHPYTIARAFASLEHLSGGRTGWNIVTTRDRPAGHNYGFSELPERAERYARAEEAVAVVTRLWDSWEPDALVADPATGVLIDTARIKPIDHVGEHFSVAGPLQVPPSPQGRPLLVQAGGSAGGQALAARFADAVFTPQHVLGPAQEFYRGIKDAVRAAGRDPQRVAVLPGLNPVVGSTEEEARRRQRELNELVAIEDRLEGFARWAGVDPDALDLDRPFPLELLGETGSTYGSAGFETATRVLLENNRTKTVRRLIDEGNTAHRSVVGTPEQIADSVEEWFRSGAADGFNVQCDVYPGGLELFVDHVVPELQRRGLFRREYSGSTLREHYGVTVDRSGRP